MIAVDTIYFWRMPDGIGFAMPSFTVGSIRANEMSANRTEQNRTEQNRTEQIYQPVLVETRTVCRFAQLYIDSSFTILPTCVLEHVPVFLCS